MDSRLIFLPSVMRLIHRCVLRDCSPLHSRVRKRGRFVAEVHNRRTEKSLLGTIGGPVLKLTQVGEASSLRRSREPSLRN